MKGLRHYRVGDALYPSVTSVLSADESKGEVLQRWRDRVGVKEADRVSYHAAYQGTVVHTLIENHLLGRPNNIKVAPHQLAHARRLQNVADDHIDNIRMVEGRLYSDDLRVAGTVDLVAEFDGDLAIIDWKTSKTKKPYEWIHGYFIQESAYAKMVEELTDLKIKKLVTIITTDDGFTQVFIESPNKWIGEFKTLRKAFFEINGS